MTAEAPPKGASALLKKLVLRLDDGTVIKGSGGGEGGEAVTVLKPADAYAAGSLTEAHLLKAQALLCEVHAKLPEEGPLRSLSMGSKRSADTGFEVGPTGSGKRSRSMGAFANGNGEDVHLESPTSAAMAVPGAYHAAPAAAPVYAAPATAPAAPAYYAPPAAMAPPTISPPTRPEWTAACNRILEKIHNKLSPPDLAIFYEPVNPAQVPDYYNIVKRPVCLKEIHQRLATGQYAGPEGFYADMDQLVYNCLLYNPVGTIVRNLGQKIEQSWVDNWRRSPILAQYQVSRQPKPQPSKQPAKAKAGAGAVRPQRSAGAAPRRAPPKGAGAARVPRTTSVNSYRNYQALPAEQQAALAEALQDEAVLAEKMDGVVGILQRANQLPTNEEGEVELDLSQISPGVVWELYEYVMGRPPPVPQQPSRSSFQLQDDSDYDPYGEEDDD